MTYFIAFLLWLALSIIFSMNLWTLLYLTRRGWFRSPFWSRSLRALFLIPPFALLAAGVLVMRLSFSLRSTDLAEILSRRGGQ